VRKTLLINDQIGTERIQEDEKVITSELDRCRSQEDDSLSVVTEKAHSFVAECILISDMVRLVNDDEIEARRRVEVKQPLLALSLAVWS
jgi:hypothetical protein